MTTLGTREYTRNGYSFKARIQTCRVSVYGAKGRHAVRQFTQKRERDDVPPRLSSMPE